MKLKKLLSLADRGLIFGIFDSVCPTLQVLTKDAIKDYHADLLDRKVARIGLIDTWMPANGALLPRNAHPSGRVVCEDHEIKELFSCLNIWLEEPKK